MRDGLTRLPLEPDMSNLRLRSQENLPWDFANAHLARAASRTAAAPGAALSSTDN